jgi:hypothetical protein
MERGIAMTRANRYWLYHGTQQPDGQSGHQLLGQFRTLANANAAGSRWLSQWKNPAAKWWHVVDIRRDTIVAESDCRSYGAPDRKATK